MQIVQVPVRTAAIRMAMLIVVVAALDYVIVFFAQKPLVWAGTIPALIPLLTPAVLFSFAKQAKTEN
jgi:hypothetical protein